MIHLHYSNRLERLVNPFAELVGEDQRRDPLGRVTVVVPGRAMQEFLKVRVAEREGVAANLGFPFLRGYLRQIAERAPTAAPIRVLDADGLQIAVFEYLRAALGAAPVEDLAAVHAYVAAAHDDRNQRTLRLFQLSGRVAWLIREYSTARRAMLERWPRAAALGDDHPLRESERWQRRIYLSLFERDGSLRAAWATGPSGAARWMLLPFAFDAIDDQSLREILPPRIHVFGIGYAGPEFIRIFARLGALTELDIYTLNPCREFWEDVGNRRDVRPPRVGGLIEEAEDPFGLEGADESLALRYWGRAGREYIRLLNETTECDFDGDFVEPAAPGRDEMLLRRVQQVILTRGVGPATAGRGDQPAPPGADRAGDDGSIRILECPGVRREIEIAANAIWSLVRHDRERGSARLRFHQIGIVVPEAVRDRYLAQVESVFGALHQIPINLVDRRLAAHSRVAEAVELLLKLPLGRFTRDEMIRLLTHPAITGRDGDPDAQVWPEWCRRLGVHFGADAGAFADTYVDPKLFDWDYALKRMALGLFMAGAPSGETRAFEPGDGREYLPFEIVDDAAASVALMVRKARTLIREAQALAASELGLADWRRVLIDLIATYIEPSDRGDERVRDLIVEAIDSMNVEGLRSDAVPYEVALELALARVAEVEEEQGTYAESGVVVGSLGALRSIPFRVVFMLGLGEADFPARGARDPFDLRQVDRRAGDVSPADRDRYMFLETLLAARDRIYLSYVARNGHTGEALEPSAVIRDLQLILREMIGADAVKRLAIAHPMSPHDGRYFGDLAAAEEPRDDRLESFDRNARRGAQMAALRADLEVRCGPVGAGELDDGRLEHLSAPARANLRSALRLTAPPAPAVSVEDTRVRLSISALRHYLECPLQGAARHALGLREEDDGDDPDAADEPLAQTRLETAILLREVLARARGAREEIERCYDEAYRLRLLGATAPVGPFAAVERRGHLARLALALAQAEAAGISTLEGWPRIAVGGVEEFIAVDRAIEPIILELDFKRTDGRRVTTVELHGAVGPVSPQLNTSLKLVTHAAANAADFLDGALGAIVLRAAGEPLPAEFMALVAGGKNDGLKPAKYTRRIHPPTRAAALAYLTQVVVDLLCDSNDYFLPIEAVEKLATMKAPGADEIEAVVGAIRDKENQYCKSDFGPVRNARTYRVPIAEIGRGLIVRRYGPLMEIFARDKKVRSRGHD